MQVSNISMAAPYRRMGFDIIRSPGRIYAFQHLVFHKKTIAESLIVSKIRTEGINRNSPIPNCCHLKSVSAAHRQRENASFVSFLAYFLSGVTHPFHPPGKTRVRRSSPARRQGTLDKNRSQDLAMKLAALATLFVPGMAFAAWTTTDFPALPKKGPADSSARKWLRRVHVPCS